MILSLLLLSPDKSDANQFEMHYYFNDDSHTMDAFIRNKCETELLSIFKEIASIIDLEIKIETEPFTEGGLKQYWKLIAKNSVQIGFLLTILTLVLTRFPPTDQELDSLQKRNLTLDIKLKQQKVDNIESKKQRDETNLADSSTNTVEVIESNLKVTKHRSNFYSYLNSYEKVIKISTNVLTNDGNEVFTQKVVERADFKSFIIESDALPLAIDEEANIEIVSPVLKKGKYKWRGLYQGQPIDFYMNDKVFKESILKQQTTFKSGVSIECILNISKKINEVGEEQVVNYSVPMVLSVKQGDVTTVTPQGKSLRKFKQDYSLQFKMNF